MEGRKEGILTCSYRVLKWEAGTPTCWFRRIRKVCYPRGKERKGYARGVNGMG